VRYHAPILWVLRHSVVKLARDGVRRTFSAPTLRLLYALELNRRPFLGGGAIFAVQADPCDKGVQLAHPFLGCFHCLGAIRKPKESHFGICLARLRVEFCDSELANLIMQPRQLLEGLASTWVTCLIRSTTMRMDPTRKCVNCADVEKFGVSEHPNGEFRHSNFRFSHRLALIDAYGDWLQQWLDQGWDGYLFTFMFNQLPGSRRAMVQQMHQQLARWYGRLATRTVRKPRSPVWAPFLPKGIFVPDLPVSKRSKLGVYDVSINDGLHMDGIVVANRWARIPETLDVHFKEELGVYLTKKLRHIDVQRITHRPRYVTEYALKSLKRSTSSEDDILVLPRTLSELSGRHAPHLSGRNQA
jgi:hypothetical protein